MKKFFDIVMPVKTAACYIFTATMCVYAVLDLVFGWGGLPDNYLFSFLLLSLAGGVLQIVAFTELVIKRLRYTLRLFVFAVPYLAVLSAIAAGFGWLPAAQPGAWALFFLIFLAVLLTMTLGFELYSASAVKNTTACWASTALPVHGMKTAGENTDACGGKPDERNEKFSTKEACAVENRTGPFRLS